MAQASTVDTELILDGPVAMFAALRSALETIAAKEVNEPLSDSLFTIAPRNITDSGENLSFVRDYNAVSNPTKHTRSLITAERNTTKSSHAGKIRLTNENQAVFVPALVVPSFKDHLISVGQINKEHNALLTNEGVYPTAKTKPDANSKFI